MRITLVKVFWALVFGALLFQSTLLRAGSSLHLIHGEINTNGHHPLFTDGSFLKKYSHPFYTQEKQIQHHFIVQFQSSITPELRQHLIDWGFEIRGYLPEDALILKGTPAQNELLKFSPEIQAILPFRAEWKIHPALINSSKGDEKLSLLISVFDPSEIPTLISEIQTLTQATLQYQGDSFLVVEANTQNILALASLDQIEWIQENPTFASLDFILNPIEVPEKTPPMLNGYESGTRLMNFEVAWQRGYTGEGQIISMADTGVDSGNVKTLHPDLKGVVKGLNMGFGSTGWEDSSGHGTHVCGSLIGSGLLSDGFIRGGAFNSKVIVESVWNPITLSMGFRPDPTHLFNPARKEGAHIQTNSWGSHSLQGSYDSVASNIDRYVWNHPDFLVLFGSGNGGEDKNRDGKIDENSISSPGTAKNIITVGASENYLLEGGIQKEVGLLREGRGKWSVEPLRSSRFSDNPLGIASFSGRGPTHDGRLKPEVVAPGTNILSTRSKQKGADFLWGLYNENYVYSGGTSMSVPLVAGAAAIVREYLSQLKNFENPSAAFIKTVLIHTATDLFPGQYGTGVYQEFPHPRPNFHEGFGRVNLDLATSLHGVQFDDNSTGVGLHEIKAYDLYVPENGGLRATLSWTDAPASPTAAKALVNDLDLEIISPNGGISTLNDHRNNTEMLELSYLPAGTYQIRVLGKNIPEGKNGKQPFALLISVL